MEPLLKRQSSHLLGVRTTGGYGPQERGSAFSVSGGAGGYGTRISSATYSTRVGSFGTRYDIQSSGISSAGLAIANEKMAMQHLNDRLATYLETVRSLERVNGQLELKIKEYTEKRGPTEGKDFSRYNGVIAELRFKIFEMIKDISHLDISLDNARLASEDFKVKMEYEISMRQMVEADVTRLRKILDDTNVIRLHLETDIETLKEELITLRKNQKTDTAELRAQISQFGVHVDVDAPKGQDLAKMMEEMRAKYEKIVLKNQEELKAWHESQITEVRVRVTESTTALKEAVSEQNESRRRCQVLDIELQSELSLKASLEATLQDTDLRYNMEVGKYNMSILGLQEEVSRIHGDIKDMTRQYDHLLNVKVQLEAEIIEYRRLLDGWEELRLEDAVDERLIQTKVVTVTQTLVDGKLVSESKDVKSSEKVVTEKI
ncbi:keratin, type I cytoskeletal 18-like [Brachionichthys hirsutus]|uniref:keratin, type I cytoskeletal 18-like n=1 Tax=Brachionichthys hirsutus TaxID=412623 RepID=UPI0036047FBC